jgi:hypothetical protein
MPVQLGFMVSTYFFVFYFRRLMLRPLPAVSVLSFMRSESTSNGCCLPLVQQYSLIGQYSSLLSTPFTCQLSPFVSSSCFLQLS